MRLFIENILALLVLLLSEAWLLKGYFISGNIGFEEVIAFIVALSFFIAKEPIKARFGWAQPPLQHDLVLFERFQALLPTDPTIRFLTVNDFGNAFPYKSINPLIEFVETWGAVDKEFLDPKLEAEKKCLFSAADEFVMEIVKRTSPVRMDGYHSVFSDQLRATGQPRPEHVLEDARVLNRLSSEFVKKYENFIRKCRAALSK